MTLDTEITNLAIARKVLATHKAEAAQLEAEIAEQHRKARERIGALVAAAQAEVDETDARIRAAALNAYHVNSDKHPHAAVTVKVYEVLEYDKDLAYYYCLSHLPNALRLDTKTFEKVAKVLEPDFVSRVEEPRATIATDLSQYEQYWQE